MITLNLNDDFSEKASYTYSNYPIYIKSGILSLFPEHTAAAHWHDDIELIYILSGEMQYNINGEIVTLLPDDGIFINSRQMHFGFSSKQCECEFICIRLHPLLLCANPAYERNYVLPLLNNNDIPYIFLKRTSIWQSEIIDAITAMYESKNKKTAPLAVQSLFLHIWSIILENTEATNKEERINTDFSILKNMLGFIQENYCKKISLNEIAKSGAVGESKCCKLFSKYLRMPPNKYLANYRLQQSINLLKNTDMTVTEIALANGFGGGSYFAEIFKKKYKISPTMYREKYK